MLLSKPRKYTLTEILEGVKVGDDMGRTLCGRWLFKEWNDKAELVINDWRVIFVAQEDLTEFEGAKILGFTWAQWKHFKLNWPHFTRTILPEWLEEIEILLRSRGLKSLVKHAITPQGAQAAKWLAEGKWKEEATTKKQKEKDAELRAKIIGKIANDDDELDKVFNSISPTRSN